MLNAFVVFIRSCLTYFLIGVLLAICSPICFIIACLPTRWRYDNRVYYSVLALFYKMLLKATFLTISVTGKENIPQKQSIIIANHQSALDIPLLGFLINSHPHVWLFLAKFTKIPFLGFIARRMNVVVDHSGLRKLVGSLGQAQSIVSQSKSHIMMFPEGGRFIDGKIHAFFYGFVRLARATKRPVIPVIMHNVNKVYPPKSFLFNNYPITITVGKPFIMDENESEDAFVDRVRAWFLEEEKE